MSRYDIVIATRNSEDRIGETLTSLKNMLESSAIDTEQVRVLIANNASTDKTADVVKSFEGQLPLEMIEAHEPGKSRALNLIVEHHLKGDIIFFTDDDVSFSRHWLDNFIKTINSQPDYAVFAGRIIGMWETCIDRNLSSWIPMGSTYAIHEVMESGPCKPGQCWGPNMAVRKSVFESGLRFNPLIGPQPSALYPMGQDTEFATRADTAGFKSYFVPDAFVGHAIKPETMNEDWVIKRAERLGYGIFAMRSEKDIGRHFPSFIPFSLELRIKKAFWRLFFPLTNFMPLGKRRFWYRWKRYYYSGLWQGYNAFGPAGNKQP